MHDGDALLKTRGTTVGGGTMAVEAASHVQDPQPQLYAYEYGDAESQGLLQDTSVATNGDAASAAAPTLFTKEMVGICLMCFFINCQPSEPYVDV